MAILYLRQIRHRCGLQSILSTPPGGFKSVSLCRDHLQILPCTRLHRFEQQGVGDADARLLTEQRQYGQGVLGEGVF